MKRKQRPPRRCWWIALLWLVLVALVMAMALRPVPGVTCVPVDPQNVGDAIERGAMVVSCLQHNGG
jgi:hypothetical protein